MVFDSTDFAKVRFLLMDLLGPITDYGHPLKVFINVPMVSTHWQKRNPTMSGNILRVFFNHFLNLSYLRRSQVPQMVVLPYTIVDMSIVIKS